MVLMGHFGFGAIWPVSGCGSSKVRVVRGKCRLVG